ncbi:MAG: hypothetical protein ACRD1T_27790, partial [Acidimicrobiia bacterium]
VLAERAISLALLAGVSFSAAVMGLLYGLVLVFHAFGLTTPGLRRVFVPGTAAIVFAFLGIALTDIVTVTTERKGIESPLGIVFLICGCLLVGGLVFVSLSGRWQRPLGSARVVSGGIFLVAIAAALVAGFVSESDAEFAFPVVLLYILMPAFAIALLVLTFTVSRTFPSED